MARIESIGKIYSDGRHNAFTDMEYWKGQYYVSFRNGPRHPTLPGMWGSGMIIRSSDLKSWDLCARFEMEGMDTSNPRFMDLGDELGALGRAIYSKQPGLLRLYEGPSGVQPYVRRASDGSTWSDPEAVLENDDFFWRRWHGAMDACARRRTGTRRYGALSMTSWSPWWCSHRRVTAGTRTW